MLGHLGVVQDQKAISWNSIARTKTQAQFMLGRPHRGSPMYTFTPHTLTNKFHPYQSDIMSPSLNARPNQIHVCSGPPFLFQVPMYPAVTAITSMVPAAMKNGTAFLASSTSNCSTAASLVPRTHFGLEPCVGLATVPSLQVQENTFTVPVQLPVRTSLAPHLVLEQALQVKSVLPEQEPNWYSFTAHSLQRSHSVAEVVPSL